MIPGKVFVLNHWYNKLKPLEKILFVDDEQHARHAMCRFLRKKYDIIVAKDGQEALEILDKTTQIGVTISDFSMAGMNGLELFTLMSEKKLDSIKILLTGRANLDIAIDAINTGNVYRFLTKPVDEITLLNSINMAFDQYRLITSEKQLLRQTLIGSIKVLSELIGATDKRAFSTGNRIRTIALAIAKSLKINNMWQVEIAAMLSQLGCVLTGNDILTKIYADQPLSDAECEIYQSHPQVGATMINKIPRLEKVAEIISLQHKPLSWYDKKPQYDETTIIQAQILKAACDFDLLVQQGNTKSQALEIMATRKKQYYQNILEIVENEVVSREHIQDLSVKFHDLVPGMIADENIYAKNGTMIFARGQEITLSAILGLSTYIEHIGIREPIRVKVICP